jgi:hypothetical protein
MTKEWLVTAQAYIKDDSSKQTILLHDTFFTDSDHKARDAFIDKFNNQYNIVKIYSIVDANQL